MPLLAARVTCRRVFRRISAASVLRHTQQLIRATSACAPRSRPLQTLIAFTSFVLQHARSPPDAERIQRAHVTGRECTTSR